MKKGYILCLLLHFYYNLVKKSKYIVGKYFLNKYFCCVKILTNVILQNCNDKYFYSLNVCTYIFNSYPEYYFNLLSYYLFLLFIL